MTPCPGDRPDTAFIDRIDAGRQLAVKLADGVGSDAVLLGLPRGGVIVAASVASELNLDLDVYVVRKLRSSLNGEYAVGAVAEDGPAFVDLDVLGKLSISPEYLQEEEDLQRTEIQRQVRRYRSGRGLVEVRAREAVIVDDGMATGATVRAAVRGIRSRRPSRVLVASPVASPLAVERLSSDVDDLIVLQAPEHFWAVGLFYRSFGQVRDEEVIDALAKAPSYIPTRLRG